MIAATVQPGIGVRISPAIAQAWIQRIQKKTAPSPACQWVQCQFHGGISASREVSPPKRARETRGRPLAAESRRVAMLEPYRGKVTERSRRKVKPQKRTPVDI